MNTLLSLDEKQRVSNAIREVEARTQGEIVTVIARAADSYLHITTLWSALIALALPGILFLLGANWPVAWVFIGQVAIFAACTALLNVTPFKMWLVPRSLKQQQASRLAREQFIAQGVHLTGEHTGVLIFVSIAERYVEIIADKGINDKVSTDCWQHVIDKFVRQVQEGRYTDGFIAAIEDCGAPLMQHFPARRHNPNELPNRLIEI